MTMWVHWTHQEPYSQYVWNRDQLNDWSIMMCCYLFVGLPLGSLVFWQMSTFYTSQKML